MSLLNRVLLIIDSDVLWIWSGTVNGVGALSDNDLIVNQKALI